MGSARQKRSVAKGREKRREGGWVGTAAFVAAVALAVGVVAWKWEAVAASRLGRLLLSYPYASRAREVWVELESFECVAYETPMTRYAAATLRARRAPRG